MQKQRQRSRAEVGPEQTVPSQFLCSRLDQRKIRLLRLNSLLNCAKFTPNSMFDRFSSEDAGHSSGDARQHLTTSEQY